MPSPYPALLNAAVPRAIALLLSACAAGLALAGPISPDHQEFEASLHVPYRADAKAIAEARSFTLKFEYPQVEQAQTVSWRLELLDPAGEVAQRWYGVETLVKGEIVVKVDWAGRQGGVAAVDGIYTVRLTATSIAATELPSVGVTADFVEANLRDDDAERVEQSWEMQVGHVAAPLMPAFQPMNTSKGQIAGGRQARSAPLAGGLPYTVYYGNLHSQTGHSDGGGPIGNCNGEQHPQANSGQGPAQAYQYAMERGLDFLLTSEHNHMFDGSTGTDAGQTPAYAKDLYRSGRLAAQNFNAAHPNFLGIYGMEWGTISGGGHLNILNSNELLGWEYNGRGELLADVFTEKNNAAKLYTLMAQRGLIGQFNHPASSGQYLVNGVALGYTPEGEQAMALCEVMNTPAFSNTTDESDQGNSGYEGACKKALEAGFKIAFTTNQDNHCANWGASGPNRNGVLIPNGTPLSMNSFMAAIKARRVFATMDKSSQLVLTANEHLMGESFSNTGPLKLVANYAPGPGRSAATVKIFQGVPQRNGTITELSSGAVTQFTPTPGKHFYYAKVTQTDGKILWSAPVWVDQVADTEAPVVSASLGSPAGGSNSELSLQAEARDNVGVLRVDFLVDGQLLGSAASAPYQLKIASSRLTAGSHSLQARAVDAAGNVGSSTPLSFNVSHLQDVSAGLRQSISGLVYNRLTQLYSGSITLSNISGAAISGPLQLKIQGLPAGVSLANASGSHGGAPFITLPTTSLAAGASLSVPLSISNPARLGLSYSASIFSGTF